MSIPATSFLFSRYLSSPPRLFLPPLVTPSQLLLPFEVLYATTLCLTKSSIISFYLRIFGPARTFRISAYISIGVLIAWALSIILEAFLLCRPLAYNWDSTIEGVCGNRSKVYISAGALNVVTDFMVMALPIPHIFGLQLRIKKKLGLVLMFSLGLLFVTSLSASPSPFIPYPASYS